MHARDLQLLLLIVAHPPVQVKLSAFSYFRNVPVRVYNIVYGCMFTLDSAPRRASEWMIDSESKKAPEVLCRLVERSFFMGVCYRC